MFLLVLILLLRITNRTDKIVSFFQSQCDAYLASLPEILRDFPPTLTLNKMDVAKRPYMCLLQIISAQVTPDNTFIDSFKWVIIYFTAWCQG